MTEEKYSFENTTRIIIVYFFSLYFFCLNESNLYLKTKR